MLKKSDVRNAIEAKTTHKARSTKHTNYTIFLDERRVIPLVTVPHGRDEVTPKTQASIQKQLKLGRQQFQRFVDCSLTQHDYEAILRQKIKDGLL